jgi:N-methylhydantoinase A
MTGAGYALAVDIGGTFTDVVLRGPDGRAWADKCLTTHADLLEGFFRAVDLALEKAGARPDDVGDVIVHATTIVTNAIIERKGAPVALLVTEGFPDVLTIRDEHRYDMYDPQIEFVAPLVTPELTFEVAERSLADGTISRPVAPDDVRNLLPRVKAAGARSVAVSFLNAYRVPGNERRVRDVLLEAVPEARVSLSSEVAPEMREYPRTSTTVVNAYAMPIAGPYLSALASRLSERGFLHRPLILLSNGGVIGADVAGRFPVRMIESGPAAGALAASTLAEELGIDELMSFDMGGTTAKVCLIQDRRPLVASKFEVDRRYRFKPGSGLPVIVPAIDMIEVGAGGGSISRVDDLGLLQVGPESAGSEPGPVCYGRGGTRPTVTDADLVLGLLSAESFLGGEMRLDASGARAAIAELAAWIGTGTEEAALGVFRVVGESMAAAVRAHATDRGIDPRGLPLLAFGGAGGIHACYVAELLGSEKVLFPPMASVLSAYGALLTPARLDLVRGALARLGSLDGSRVAGMLEEMEAEGRSALEGAGIAAKDVTFTYGADMRYYGQANEVTVELTSDPRDRRDSGLLRKSFERAYEALYGIRLPEMDVEVVSFRVSAHGPPVRRAQRVELAPRPGSPIGERPALFGGSPLPTPVYARRDLAAGQSIDGPAILEERETTLVIPPLFRATVEEQGTIVARPKRG